MGVVAKGTCFAEFTIAEFDLFIAFNAKEEWFVFAALMAAVTKWLRSAEAALTPEIIFACL